MKLSAFTVADGFLPGADSGRDRLAEVLQLAVECDRAGLSGFWVAEHHFHQGGVCPSPPVLLSAVGQRTERIRIGVLVSVLPFHNAVDAAEQYALLDHLTNGRLNLGVGSGYIPLEFEGFGVDPETKRERFESALDTILAAFRGEEVHVDGTASAPVRLNVRPVQSPSPPIWVAVQRREALPFVARRGFSVALIPYATVESIDELAAEIREFRAEAVPGKNAIVSAAVHVYAGPRPELARAALQRYLDGRRATQSTFYQEKVQRDPRHALASTIERAGLAAIGTVDEVHARLMRFEDAGVDELLGIFDFGGLPIDEALGSVRALAKRFEP